MAIEVKVLGYTKKKSLPDMKEKYYLVTDPIFGSESGPIDYEVIERIKEEAAENNFDFDEYIEVSFMTYVKKSAVESY